MVIFCALLVLLSGQALGERVLVDRLIAEVAGKPLTYSQVLEKVRKGPLVAVSAFPARSDDPPFEIALQDLTNFTIIMNKAEELEIEVSDEEVENRITSFLSERRMSREQLFAALDEQGMTYDQYRDDFQKQMILSKFKGRVIRPLVKITDKDIESHFKKISGTKTSDVELSLRQLFVSVSPDSPEAVVQGKQAMIREISTKLKSGMPFTEAVKVYSDDSSARDSGGLMPPVALGDLSPAFANEIRNLKSGEFTVPIKSGAGYHIFYLEDSSITQSSTFQSKKTEIEQVLIQEETEIQTRRWLESERARSDIKFVKD